MVAVIATTTVAAAATRIFNKKNCWQIAHISSSSSSPLSHPLPHPLRGADKGETVKCELYYSFLWVRFPLSSVMHWFRFPFLFIITARKQCFGFVALNLCVHMWGWHPSVCCVALSHISEVKFAFSFIYLKVVTFEII